MPVRLRVVSDRRKQHGLIVRDWILETPKGKSLAVWLYEDGTLRVIDEKGHSPLPAYRYHALNIVSAILANEAEGRPTHVYGYR